MKIEAKTIKDLKQLIAFYPDDAIVTVEDIEDWNIGIEYKQDNSGAKANIFYSKKIIDADCIHNTYMIVAPDCYNRITKKWEYNKGN